MLSSETIFALQNIQELYISNTCLIIKFMQWATLSNYINKSKVKNDITKYWLNQWVVTKVFGHQWNDLRAISQPTLPDNGPPHY